jgi:antitoxin component YwqK of YwqJK toxin-antitoxin module
LIYLEKLSIGLPKRVIHLISSNMKTYRSFLLLIFLSVFTIYANCQKPSSTDKIKSLIVMEEKSDMLVKKQYKESETYYDIKGNVIESITYKQGKTDKHFKYQYDSDNNKIKEEEFDVSGRLKESSEYKYSEGQRIEKTVFDPNKKIKSRKTYIYTKF